MNNFEIFRKAEEELDNTFCECEKNKNEQAKPKLRIIKQMSSYGAING